MTKGLNASRKSTTRDRGSEPRRKRRRIPKSHPDHHQHHQPQRPAMLGIWAHSSLRSFAGRPTLQTLSKVARTAGPSSIILRHLQPLHRNTLSTICLRPRLHQHLLVRFSSTQAEPPTPKLEKKSIWAHFLPSKLGKGPKSVSSVQRIFALAKPERKPLLIAIGLLLLSSAVSMSVPFTIGKLIDFFASPNPVGVHSLLETAMHHSDTESQQIPLGLSIWQATGLLLVLFTAGALANAGRAMLMRLSGMFVIGIEHTLLSGHF